MIENTWLKQERIRAEKEKKATGIRQRELYAESQKVFKEREKQKAIKAKKQQQEKKKAAIQKSKAQKTAKKATKKKAPKKKRNVVKTLRTAKKTTKGFLSIFR